MFTINFLYVLHRARLKKSIIILQDRLFHAKAIFWPIKSREPRAHLGLTVGYFPYTDDFYQFSSLFLQFFIIILHCLHSG